MKKLTTILVVVLAVAFTSNIFAQNSATVASASASAKIIAPITLSNSVAMDFGTVASTTDGGDVTLVVAPNGSVTRTFENSNAQATTLGNPKSAKFDVAGEANAAYNISIPADGVVSLNGPSGSTPMAVKTFTSTVATNGGTLNGSGTQTFYVGATLDVNATQTAGTYSGTYSVTVQYQ
ncbi:MAG TPA: DUF4402 domain-containing protein [Lentimicrobium sp.]|nr:DUF4402 domain-containing protein [Lentimicrobium sp.]